MTSALSRKRSRLDTSSDGEPEHHEIAPRPLASLKRSKTQGELDELDIISAEEAWTIDVDSIFASRTLATSSERRKPHDNAARYVKGESIVILCVQGNLSIHYELLWAILPSLYTLAPTLQALILCHDPSTHIPSPTIPYSLPLIQGAEGKVNHFVRLGLLHPLGGGHFPLDALVVLDGRGRRRCVLPFGWGAGRYAGTRAGKGVQGVLMGLLRRCVEELVREHSVGV